jgi:hypothetical protein
LALYSTKIIPYFLGIILNYNLKIRRKNPIIFPYFPWNIYNVTIKRWIITQYSQCSIFYGFAGALDWAN